MKYYLIIKDATWTIDTDSLYLLGYKDICDNLMAVLDFNKHTEADQIYLKFVEINKNNQIETLIKQYQFNNITEAKNKIKNWSIYQ